MSSNEYDPLFPFVFMDLLDDDSLLELLVVVVLICGVCGRKRKRSCTPNGYSMIARIPTQLKHLSRLVGVTDADCIANLRMNRNCFGRLVMLLRQVGGLVDGKYVSVEEQVATFLSTIAHHKKNRVLGFDYWRSGQTVSKYFHLVLLSILMLHGILLVKPDPMAEDSTDLRWKWFKGCLGALDGTYINVQVSTADTPRYRTRKGQISTNTLAVCDRRARFFYVLPGWEGSVADSRVLRDAVNRSQGFKVPKGNYYLADSGYANCEGIITPYRGVRYHLKEWGSQNAVPSNAREMFNMRHSKARNIIERAFGILKMRWSILRSHSFYPIKTQIQIIGACFLLHNFIRSEMEVDPIEEEMGEQGAADLENEGDNDIERIESLETSVELNRFRDELAESMWAAGHG